MIVLMKHHEGVPSVHFQRLPRVCVCIFREVYSTTSRG